MSQETVSSEKLAALIRKAAGDVFSLMLGFDLQALPYQVVAEPETASGGILALIGFSGTWTGTATIGCTPTMACRIADALFMTTHTAVEDEVLDAVAEMANIIIGNVKTDLENELGPMALSIPTVIYGKNFIKRSLTRHDFVVAPFASGDEKLEVQLCVLRAEHTDHARAGFLRPCSLHV